MRRKISSDLTFANKVIFPIIFIGVFGFAALSLLRANDKYALGYLVAFLFAFTFSLWACFPLKKVEADENFLYVSNYRTTIQVPITEIEDVEENMWMNPPHIRIKLKHRTRFGDKILFEPRRNWKTLITGRHPFAAELRTRAGLPLKTGYD